jgi:MFS family permease
MEGIENRSFLLKAALVVGGGGLIFGYDIGVISTTITAMKEDISMDDISEGWVMGIMGVGAIVGAIIAGPLCDVMGRWRTIQLQNVLFCAGSIVTGCARGLDGLYIGRFIIGMASAVSSVADIPYLNEISPPSVRGQVTSAYELLTSLGVLLSFLVGWLCVGGADSSHSINDNEGSGSGSGWRAAFLLPVALALAQSLGMLSLPESPQWLLEKQRAEEAGAALQLVRVVFYSMLFLHFLVCDGIFVSLDLLLRACILWYHMARD